MMGPNTVMALHVAVVVFGDFVDDMVLVLGAGGLFEGRRSRFLILMISSTRFVNDGKVREHPATSVRGKL